MDNWINKSKKVSYALRHAPQEFGITLDKEGWTDLNLLLEKLNLTKDEIDYMINHMEKKRFEIEDDKIRAFYGHSVEEKIVKKEMEPPELLYHGTDPKIVQTIFKEGLKPMSRQYIHLTVDIKTARKTGQRKCDFPVILVIDAKKAFDNGIKFYFGNEDIWLADYIPSNFIK